MKNYLFAVLFITMFFSAARSADTAVLAPEVIAASGQTVSRAGHYSTGKDSTFAIKAGLSRIDLLPESGARYIKAGRDAGLKLEKGTAWVRCADQKTVVTAGAARIEASNAVFSVSLSAIDVYSGFVNVSIGKKTTRVGMGMRFEPAVNKLADMTGVREDEAARQISMDQFDMLCSLNLETADFTAAREAFKGAFRAFYHAGKTYFSFDNTAQDYDLSFDLKIDKKEQKYQFKGLIKNPLTNETIGVFSDDEPADQNGMSSGLTKAGIQAGRAMQYYGSKVLTEGTRVFVEAESGNTENSNEIKEILEKTPGVSSLKYSDFQGKKVVFDMLFTGNGYDMAVILRDTKVQNKHINIWKYSKFVVKLTIV